jgi:Na+-driven multidrug efflux pump
MFPIRLGIYYFGYPAVGSDILWWSFPLSSLASLAMAWAIYRRGNWRRTLSQPTA